MIKLEKNIIENIYQSKYEELDEKIIKKIKENKNRFSKIKELEFKDIKIKNQIEEQIKNPYFRLDDIPDNYTIEEAVYSKLHRNINYRISWGNQYLYVSQQMEIDDTSNGTIDGEAVDEIAIKDLGQTVTIYCSAHDNSLNCSILYDKTVLFLVTNLEKEEFERIIGGIEYQ